ncbi:NAD dependent epimerase/dehydratase [Colletotrichum graminicola]|uniref:NAD dependent epimerase/dehydratase n=1 Tax=Colletotrichum graminicola (strain M1.001 / M2 / FGSC 10212) TaxID=645133 RepID=E3QVB3_COLGM|nr:NAD dependent epimerase/dehydratase [Colletotrichum graminicola M1.001]EFQ34801.1 NAD dependent epimerase/dehydratase [Colletotrichum graminicola M1.001]WDK10406.1 NAD dependent epimerase/dehydratase [Colletotrichum graminicola]
MPQRVLVTGANGFIAQHILGQFLAAGHSVRAVVRSESSASKVRKTFSSYLASSQLDIALVPDITAPGAFDAALASDPPFETVLHTASPFDFRKGNSSADFLGPAIRGTTEILHGVRRAAPAVKRVVVTSSMAAMIDISRPPVSDPPKIYGDRDWFEVSERDAETSENPHLPYVASKALAEKAAWAFVEEEKPAFDLVTINPPMVYGPLLDTSELESPLGLNQSNYGLYETFFAPGLTATSPVPPAFLHLYVDVRDVARAHFLAATKPAAGGRRFVVSPGGVSNQTIANVVRERLPELEGRIPKGDPTQTALPKGIYGADGSLAEKVLGLEYTKLEDTFGDIATQIAELEKRAEKAA